MCVCSAVKCLDALACTRSPDGADRVTVASQGVEHWTLESIPRNSTVFVSFSNKHYSDFMLNWSKHLQRLQVRLCYIFQKAISSGVQHP